jgi:type IV pilus assembly protein PilX
MLKKQSGAVLVISLVILIMLTVLVLSGTQSTLMQEKMTSAIRDSHMSLEVAESGVRDAEIMIAGLSSLSSFNDTGVGGLYNEGKGPQDLFDDNNWLDNITRAATTSSSGPLSRYFIEYLGELSLEEAISKINVESYVETAGGGDIHGFKIVSRSLGRDGNAERIIVSYFGKRF